MDESDALEPAVTRRGEKTMGFLEHLEELRWTLVKCAFVVVGFAVLSGVFLTEVRHFLEWPWVQALANDWQTLTY